MVDSELLEITITHNLTDATEVRELFRRRLIALDWDRKGPDPNAYAGRAKIDVRLFHTMRENGAAVIAAYKTATARPSDRLLGRVRKGASFKRVNGLLCLPLTATQVVDSSKGFLGNLAPRGCTVQTCGNRAKGRLAAMVLGQNSPRTIGALHPLDVEWLITNYLMVTRMCECVWSGSRSYEAVDHAGRTPDGRELLAQTTVSASLVGTKAAKLLTFASDDRVLHFFGPAGSTNQCPGEIVYHAIEDVFLELDSLPSGRWLINRMLVSLPSATDIHESNHC